MTQNTPSSRRPIRSFVVRSARMTASQKKGWDTYWPDYGATPDMGREGFDALFSHPAPTVMEIGFGMGGSLFEMASNQPEYNFIGIEVHKPGVGALLQSAGEAELKNLRVFCCDANDVIEQCLPAAALRRVQIYFPDPWHKKRHHKRRLIQSPFIQKLLPKLEVGGCIHLATDWEPYAEHMLEVLGAEPGLKNLSERGGFSDKPDFRPTTKFETRGRRRGHGVWDLLFEKLETDPI